MATFTGTYADETITPTNVSPTVISNPAGSLPSDLADILYGYGGNDILDGGGGNDTLNGGTGNDTMFGGMGNDIYVVDSAGDVVSEAAGAGTDIVYGYFNYTLTNNVENLSLFGSATSGNGNTLNNIIKGSNLANALDGRDGNDTLYGYDGNDSLIGGSGYDYLYGGNGNDTLDGGLHNDLLDGGTGNDSMSGGAGNDTYVVDTLLDVVSEAAGAGTDRVNAYINYTLGDNVENVFLYGTAATGTGNALNNAIVGTSSANSLSGLAGNDTLTGY